MMRDGKVWAVAGGKGGTGKTFFLYYLALQLTSLGKKTILVDADLGGPNLHSLLGIRSPAATLTDFFDKKKPLQEIIQPTDTAGLFLIPGNLKSLNSEAIQHSQKLKLFRQIRALDADCILLDLGAGTHAHTVDCFLFADRRIIVSAPEVSGLDNMYHFIKSVYFRKLNALLKERDLKEIAKERWQNRKQYNINSLLDLICSLRDVDLGADSDIKNELAQTSIQLIMNQVRNRTQAQLGFSVKSVCTKLLGIRLMYSGFIHYDPEYWQLLREKAPGNYFKVSQAFASVMAQTTERLLHKKELQLHDV